MLHEAVAEASTSPDAVRRAYYDELAEVVDAVGADTVVGATGLDRATVVAVRDGEQPAVTLEEAAEVLALADGAPDAQSIAAETRDHLMMGMVTAVLDVDTLAADLSVDMDGKAVQQAIEGRMPVTLAQLADVHNVIAANTPD